MTRSLRNFIQYVFILAATVFLVWFSLRGLTVQEGNKWDYLVDTWRMADKGWLFLMAGVTILSHIVRAERWKMLIIPAGHTPTLRHSFLSLMVGYLVNLVIPRGGEVSRCYNLYKLDKTPVDVSFGTVVVERIVDLICLMILIVFTFFIESKKLFAFLETLSPSTSGHSEKLYLLLYLILVGLAFLMGMYLLMRYNKKVNAFVLKTWLGFKKGLLTIFSLENKWLFIFYSVIIWSLYFLMSYTVIMAFPATANLGFGAVLTLFGIGAIAMAAPLPGGTGSYHVLVPQGLMFLYLIPEREAIAFTFIFHGWQTLIMIVGGAVSLIITSLLIKKSTIR